MTGEGKRKIAGLERRQDERVGIDAVRLFDDFEGERGVFMDRRADHHHLIIVEPVFRVGDAHPIGRNQDKSFQVVSGLDAVADGKACPGAAQVCGDKAPGIEGLADKHARAEGPRQGLAVPRDGGRVGDLGCGQRQEAMLARLIDRHGGGVDPLLHRRRRLHALDLDDVVRADALCDGTVRARPEIINAVGFHRPAGPGEVHFALYRFVIVCGEDDTVDEIAVDRVVIVGVAVRQRVGDSLCAEGVGGPDAGGIDRGVGHAASGAQPPISQRLRLSA